MKRELTRLSRTGAALTGLLPPGDIFQPDMPWDAVFKAAAIRQDYWDQEVRRPATNFLARGGGHISSMPNVSAEARQAVDNVSLALTAAAGRHVDSALESPLKQIRTSPWGQGVSKQALAKKRLREGNEAQPPPAPLGGKDVAKGGGKGDHPRKLRNGDYMTTREGKELCFKFARGGEEKCPSPCAQGRAHACQRCLQPHPTRECKQTGKGKSRSQK
jgi:hypothetical protein